MSTYLTLVHWQRGRGLRQHREKPRRCMPVIMSAWYVIHGKNQARLEAEEYNVHQLDWQDI
jgi:hypothetical protein